jgi:hypothetical protein
VGTLRLRSIQQREHGALKACRQRLKQGRSIERQETVNHGGEA